VPSPLLLGSQLLNFRYIVTTFQESLCCDNLSCSVFVLLCKYNINCKSLGPSFSSTWTMCFTAEHNCYCIEYMGIYIDVLKISVIF
jgi:hypothetical protein